MLTPEQKADLTEKLTMLLEAQGRALQVECVREDQDLQYEFRAWVDDRARAVTDRVARRALDDSAVGYRQNAVELMIRRLCGRFEVIPVSRSDEELLGPDPVGVIYTAVKEFRKDGAHPEQVAARLVGDSQQAQAAPRIKVILDYLTLRQTHRRVVLGTDGRYRAFSET